MQVLGESIRKFTPTEIQIVNLIKQNKSSKQIAGFLGVSPRTVNNDWIYARAWLARDLQRNDPA